MSLNVNIGTIGEDPRCLTKSPSWSAQVSCDVYENCSVINPVLILDYKSAYTACNYLSIPDWNRYYFIESINLQPGGKAILQAHCDVLYTYSSALQSIQFRLSRSETDYDSSIPDPQFTYGIQYDTIYANNQWTGAYSDLFGDTGGASKSIILGTAGSSNVHFYDVTGYTLHATEPATYSGAYRYFYINVGSASKPDMMQIGVAIDTHLMTDQEASSFSVCNELYGPIYSKNSSS